MLDLSFHCTGAKQLGEPEGDAVPRKKCSTFELPSHNALPSGAAPLVI